MVYQVLRFNKLWIDFYRFSLAWDNIWISRILSLIVTTRSMGTVALARRKMEHEKLASLIRGKGLQNVLSNGQYLWLNLMIWSIWYFLVYLSRFNIICTLWSQNPMDYAWSFIKQCCINYAVHFSIYFVQSNGEVLFILNRLRYSNIK